jgi:hypothetical protein
MRSSSEPIMLSIPCKMLWKLCAYSRRSFHNASLDMSLHFDCGHQ